MGRKISTVKDKKCVHVHQTPPIFFVEGEVHVCRTVIRGGWTLLTFVYNCFYTLSTMDVVSFFLFDLVYKIFIHKGQPCPWVGIVCTQIMLVSAIQLRLTFHRQVLILALSS